MKRLSLPTCALLIVGGCLLTACSKNETQTSNSSASTSKISVASSNKNENTTKESESSTMSSTTDNTNTSSSTPEVEQSMSVSGLVNGDYKSVKGVWQDEQGNQLTFDEQGLVSDTYTFNGVSATDYATAAGGIYGGETGGFLIEFIPHGVTISDHPNFKDNSDVNRDRIWTGVGMNSFDEQGHFYYRISQ